jgi:hypothetical protein
MKETAEPSPAGQFWIIAKAPTTAQRETYLTAVQGIGWRVLDRQEFTQTTVLCVERME